MMILRGSIAQVNTTIERLSHTDVCLFVYSKQCSMQFRIFRMSKNFSYWKYFHTVPPRTKLKLYEVLLNENFGNEKRQITVLQDVACLTAVGDERLAGVYGSKVAVIDVRNIAGTGIEHQSTAVGIAIGIV